MKPIKTLIIGLGQIGMLYDLNHENQSLVLTHSKAVSQNKYFELVGGVDKDDMRRREFSRKFRKKAFKEIEDALTFSSPDLIIIATHTESHLGIIKHISKIYKPKIILCEKPLAYNFIQAEEILEICRNMNTKLFVNYMRRCDPSTIEIKDRINTKLIETPIKGFCWYTKGVYNNASHFINLLEMWLGKIEDLKLLKKSNINKYDLNAYFLLQFEKGKIFFQPGFENKFTHNCFEFISPNGKLTYNEGGKNIYWQNLKIDPNFKNHSIINEQKNIIQSEMGLYQENVLNSLRDSLIGKTSTICTGKQALSSLKSLEILRSEL